MGQQFTPLWVHPSRTVISFLLKVLRKHCEKPKKKKKEANDLLSPTLNLSLPIPFPLPSQLDDAARRPLYNCLDIKLEGCKRYKPESVEFHECITKSFFNCLSKSRKYLRRKEEIETYKIGKECLNTSLKKCKDSRLH